MTKSPKHIHVIVIGPPGTSGADVLARLRGQNVNAAPVVLIHLVEVAEERIALDGKASDSTSPSIDVLTRRLGDIAETLKEASRRRSDRTMLCGELLLRPDFSRAYWRKVELNLTRGEYNIVQLLASNAGRHVSYRNVYDCLRHEGFIAGRGALGYRANVRSAIKRIRDKFRALDATFDWIENYSNFGYRWKKLP